MDDDYFIGNKLSKNDFFYVKNGKILPVIPTDIFLKQIEKLLKKIVNFIKKKQNIVKKNKTMIFLAIQNF